MFARIIGALLLLSGLPLFAQDAALLPETMYVQAGDAAPAFNCVGDDCERLALLPAGAGVTITGQTEGAELKGSALWYEVQLDCPCFDYAQRELLEPPVTKVPGENRWYTWQPYYSPDGTRIASVSGSVLYVWDAASGERLVNAPLDLFHGRIMAWSPDGTRIVAGGGVAFDEDGEHHYESERNLLVVDADGGAPVRLSGQDMGIWNVSWSHDGTRIATTGNELRIWDVAQGSTLLHIDEFMTQAVWSPDDARILTNSPDNGLQIRDSSSGEVLSAIDVGDDIRISGGMWSPEGTPIAYVARNEINSPYGSLRLWDGVTLEPSAPLVEAEDWISGVSWSPDSRFLVYGADGEIAIQEPEDSRILARPLMRPREYMGDFWAQSLAWSPAGNQIVASGFDLRGIRMKSTAQIWDLTLVSEAPSRAWMHSSLLGETAP